MYSNSLSPKPQTWSHNPSYQILLLAYSPSVHILLTCIFTYNTLHTFKLHFSCKLFTIQLLRSAHSFWHISLSQPPVSSSVKFCKPLPMSALCKELLNNLGQFTCPLRSTLPSPLQNFTPNWNLAFPIFLSCGWSDTKLWQTDIAL